MYCKTGFCGAKATTEDCVKWLGGAYDDSGVSVEGISRWQIKKFATKVKQVLSLLTGIPVEDMEKEEVKNSYLPKEWNRHEYILTFENGSTISTLLKASEEEATNKLTEIIGDLDSAIWETTSTTYATHPMTVRHALQYIGTDLFRDKFHEDTWCTSLFAEYKPIMAKGELVTIANQHMMKYKGFPNYNYPNWLITDVRFPNEGHAIKDRGGILIRVNRPITNIVIKDSGIIKPQLHTRHFPTEHKSETLMDSYDKFHYTLDNSGTIEELIEQVREILTKENLI